MESQFPKKSFILIRSSLIFDLPKEFCFILPQEYHIIITGLISALEQYNKQVFDVQSDCQRTKKSNG